jgi:hypothetical protein
MAFLRIPERQHLFLFLALVAPTILPAQTTTVNVGSTVIQSPVKRFGINIGTPNYYDSGQITKNLVFTNPSFEGEIYQSTIRCISPTANSCTDQNVYSGFPASFWNQASYTVISGAAAGRTGTVCSFSGANYNGGVNPTGGTFTFCDSGTAPATNDYIVVKTTMPANLGWPDGDWQTVLGGGTLTAETNDLPPGTLGKQSALLTATTANDAIAVNTFFDTTPGKSFIQLNGQYQITFQAKGVSGNKNVAVKLTRGSTTFISQTVPLTGSWAPYTLTFTGAENGSAVGNVELSFNAVGPDTIELDDISLVKMGTDPTNTTIFRDEVVQAFQNAQPGVIRYWLDQLGESLDNLLTPPTGRQRSGYTPYAGFDGENIIDGGTVGTYQTQSVKVGLTDFLQLCQKVGADPWIVMPSTLSAGEAYSLIDYLAGSSSTTYGAKRAAAGQTAPWTSVFKVIHLEYGNEEWNGGTFKGGAIETGNAYGQAASNIFTAIKGNPSYVQSQFDLIINGQSASPYSNYYLQSFIKNNDSFSIAPYMMYNINSWDTYDKLFGTTFAEAEAFVTPSASAEGVSGGFITVEQNPATGSGKPIVTSEMNLGPVGIPPSGGDGPMTQTIINGYASSVAGGVAVIDSMLQQLRAGVLTQNLFSLPGYITSTQTGTTAYLWGAVVDMGVTNLKRPQYLALQMANQAIGSNTQMLQTTQTGTNPTDGQYDYDINSVSLPSMHLIQSFAFSGSGTNSVIVINASPDFAEPVNFAGTNAPTGTVNITQLTSANPTDTNETSAVVVPAYSTVSNFSSSNTLSLPPYSMTVLTWGGSTQAAPQISGVSAAPTSNSAVITWTTDEASTSQVSYGTSLPYGAQTTVSSNLVTTHSVTLTGLTPGTTYDYAVISANSSNASTTSANFTFTTTAAAPVISAVASGSITSTSAIITWTTDQPSSSLVNYGTSTGYGSSSTLSSALVTSHSVTLTGLTPGTTYDFDVVSANGSSLSSTSANNSFTTLAAAGPVISAVASGSITSTSAIITWTTDQASSSQVKYGTTQTYGSNSNLNNNLQTSHSVTLSGLTPGTTYDFVVVSTNSSSVTSTSTNYTFATTAVAPVISAVASGSITSTSAIITWTTDQSSSSQVNYGITTGYGSSSALSGTLVTSHSITLTGLTPGTTYDFDVVSTNGSSLTATSTNYSFTTTAVAPVISAVSSSSITSTSAIITWTTDQASSSQVNYGTSLSYGSSSTLSSSLVTSHSVTLTGLTPGTTYDFDVVSTNGSSLTATSTNYSFATTAPAAPVISAVASGSITSTSAVITWTTDQASSSQVKYGTTQTYGLMSGQNNSLVTSHSVTLSGLTAGTTYDFEVISSNGSSVTSTSANFTFTTTAAAAPVISAVATSAITSSSVTITWTTDQASSSLVNYGTTTGYGSASSLNSSLVTSHSVTLTGLTAGTTYNFDVVSANSSSVSGTSANSTFATLASTSPAPYVGYVAFWSINNTGITISWSTDQLATTQLAYGTTTALGQLSPLQTTLAASHGVVLTTLNPGTTYYFVAQSTNASGVTGYSTVYTFTTTGTASTPAPVISAVTATNITSNSATITWTTDQASSSLVNYGTTQGYGASSTLNTSLVTSHSVTLTGLTAGTTYDFDVVSANSSSISSSSTNYTFTTTAGSAPQAPVISSVATSAITSSSVTITWTTDQASSSLVNYGTTTGYGSSSTLDTSLVTSHSVTLTGLTAGTTYDFDVVSANASNVSSTSTNSTFATSAATGPAPYVGYVAFWGINNTGITISWSTDQPANTQLAYGTTTALGQLSPLQTTLAVSHGVVLTTLNPGTKYYFVAQSANASGVTGYSTVYTFTTSGTATTPAPVISAVTATSITTNSATITWTTDQASTSLVNYGTTTSYGSSSTPNSSLVTSHSVTLTGLTPGTTYDFDVVSANSSNVSSNSANSSFTTNSAVAGPVISAVSTSALSSTSVTITWTTDQASSSLVNYGTTTGYGSSSTPNSSLVTSHSVTLTGLTPGTTYDFDVVSANSSSVSSTSANNIFTTTAAAAPVISNVATSALSSTSVTITWTTDQASSSLVNYGTTTGYGSSSTPNTNLVTSHSVTLTGLTAGTTYDFDVVSTNASSVSGTSSNSTFTTSVATGTPPNVSYVADWGISNTGATVTWSTDQLSTTQLAYGTTTALGQLSPLQATLASSHGVTLTGLNPGTTYYFVAQSTNAGGTTGYSTQFSFTTTGSSAPVISGVTVTPGSGNTATIKWTTSTATYSYVQYGPAAGSYNRYSGQTSLTTAPQCTLPYVPSGVVHYQLVSTDAYGDQTVSADLTFTEP